jgi:hypothetical protein
MCAIGCGSGVRTLAQRGDSKSSAGCDELFYFRRGIISAGMTGGCANGSERVLLAAYLYGVYPEYMSQPIREVDPNDLRLPPSRASGADPWKLHQQIQQYGSSKAGMPRIFVYEDPNGVLEISDGVTRATRIAKLAPGVTVPVIVIGRYRRSRANSPCVRDRI